MKLELGVSVAVIAILVILVAVLLTGQQQTQQPGKVTSVPTEIKSTQEASNLEQDTSKILSEVGDTLNNIDASLPEV